LVSAPIERRIVIAQTTIDPYVRVPLLITVCAALMRP
jgi:hypothetical protein